MPDFSVQYPIKGSVITAQFCIGNFPLFSLTDGCSMWNHSEPIWVSLRHLSPGTDAVAAQWSLKALEKHGSWSQEGCQLVHSDSSTSTMRCSLLSNYAVLQVR